MTGPNNLSSLDAPAASFWVYMCVTTRSLGQWLRGPGLSSHIGCWPSCWQNPEVGQDTTWQEHIHACASLGRSIEPPVLDHGAPFDFNRLKHTPSKHNSWIGFPITVGIKFPHVNPGGGEGYGETAFRSSTWHSKLVGLGTMLLRMSRRNHQERGVNHLCLFLVR